jgi:hypothetical protein
MTDKYPAPDHHLPLREVLPGLWLASSRISMPIPLGQRITFSRNMVALLQADGWVLVNPVRLSEAAEKELLASGPIRHAVRLGTFHGQDDAYYVDRFGPEFWAVPGPQKYSAPRITRELKEGGAFPVAGAGIVVFKATQAECVVHLPQHRLLLTCDSVQHYEKDDPLISTLGRIVMRPMGFFTPCVIGPIWLKQVTPEGGSLRPDFERILALDFDNLISAHGSPKLGGAKQALAANVARLS